LVRLCCEFVLARIGWSTTHKEGTETVTRLWQLSMDDDEFWRVAKLTDVMAM
jgi:hypothetical protein